jgi:hypothetical protein
MLSFFCIFTSPYALLRATVPRGHYEVARPPTNRHWTAIYSMNKSLQGGATSVLGLGLYLSQEEAIFACERHGDQQAFQLLPNGNANALQDESTYGR